MAPPPPPALGIKWQTPENGIETLPLVGSSVALIFIPRIPSGSALWLSRCPLPLDLHTWCFSGFMFPRLRLGQVLSVYRPLCQPFHSPFHAVLKLLFRLSNRASLLTVFLVLDVFYNMTFEWIIKLPFTPFLIWTVQYYWDTILILYTKCLFKKF